MTNSSSITFTVKTCITIDEKNINLNKTFIKETLVFDIAVCFKDIDKERKKN